MKIGCYLIVYSVMGYVVENVINLVYFGFWIDNSVLIGPYQPMYAIGVLLTLWFYNVIKPLRINRFFKLLFLWVVAVLFTGLSEWVSGSLYEYFYHALLWDYQLSFSVCRHPYVCIFPTTLFGLMAVFSVLVVHPFVRQFSMLIPRYVKGVVILIFIADIIYTYYEVLR